MKYRKYNNRNNNNNKNIKNSAKVKNSAKIKNNPFKNVDVYVVRVKNEGITSMSKPCFHCANSLRMAGIRRVYYSTGNYLNGEWICEKSSDITGRVSSGNVHRDNNK